MFSVKEHKVTLEVEHMWTRLCIQVMMWTKLFKRLLKSWLINNACNEVFSVLESLGGCL